MIVGDTCAIVSSKYYSLTHNKIYIGLSALSLALTGVFFALALNFKGMALTNILWAAWTTIVISSIGVYFFKEEITILQIIGIGVILLGLILVNYE